MSDKDCTTKETDVKDLGDALNDGLNENALDEISGGLSTSCGPGGTHACRNLTVVTKNSIQNSLKLKL